MVNVSLEAWLTIVAILIGPLAALLIEKRLEKARAKEARRVQIFRDLMAHRANRLSAAFVQALNGIETEFYGDTKVIEGWRSLVDQLYTQHDPASDPNLAHWNERTTNLLTDMLYEMAESLGYHFSKVTLKKNAYMPSGWGAWEAENTKLRQAAIKVFEGEKPLKVQAAPPDEPSDRLKNIG
jgi:hypothetical protein